MNYFDASALVKRYVREHGTTTVRRLLARGDAATCRLSEAEISSALARRRRKGSVSAGQHERALRALRADLERLHVVELSPSVVAGVHRLLAAHPLRAADALQLASAIAFRDALAADVAFVAYDARLRASARLEGLDVQPRALSRTRSEARTD